MNELYLIIVGVFVVIFFLIGLSPHKKTQGRKRKSSNKDKPNPFYNPLVRGNEICDHDYSSRPLLRKGEFAAFLTLNKIISDNKIDLFVCPEIPLIAFIQQDKNNHIKLQSGYRVDFALMDRERNVVAVIEINGSGHGAKNDLNKRMILEKAMIPCIPIKTNDWDEQSGYFKFVSERVTQATAMFFERYTSH